VPNAVAIDSDKLLDIARLLAYDGQGRGRPSPAYLRRAVSSAYYALFHALARRAAKAALPQGTPEQQLRVSRTLDHGEMKVESGWITGQQGLGKSSSLGGVIDQLKQTQIQTVARVFWDLQEERHAADYDHLSLVTQAGAIAQIQVGAAPLESGFPGVFPR
jgi:hypothetical protein